MQALFKRRKHMADTVLNTTVFDGAKKLITHFNVVFSEEAQLKLVDVSELNSNNGKTCKTVRLNKVSFNVSVTAPVMQFVYNGMQQQMLYFKH